MLIMVFHFAKLEAKSQRKGLVKIWEILTVEKIRLKNNLFGIHPSIYFTNSYYLRGILLGVMGKLF